MNKLLNKKIKDDNNNIILSQDIRMSFGLNKCAVLEMKWGRK